MQIQFLLSIRYKATKLISFGTNNILLKENTSMILYLFISAVSTAHNNNYELHKKSDNL